MEILFNRINGMKYCLSEIGESYSGLTGKGKDDFSNGNSFFISYMNVFKNEMIRENLFNTVKIGDNENQNLVMNGDVFFTISSETKEEVGMCSTYNGNKNNVYLNSFCFGYRLNNLEEIDNNYFVYLMRSNKYRKIISNLGQGFTRVNLSKNLLLKIDVEIPNIIEQKKVVKILKDMSNIIEIEERKNAQYKNMKNSLLQKMFI